MLRATLLPVLLLAACTASEVEVAPPRYDLYFPTGLAVSPDERYLFVVNANSDLRYSHGTLQVFDLEQIDQLAAAWSRGEVPATCAGELARPTVLGCPLTLADGQPSPAIVPGAVVGIGNFGVSVGVQRLRSGGAESPILRFFASVRGDPSVTWGDFDTQAGTMTCSGPGGYPRCDQTHRLARQRNDAELPPLTAEPFNIFVDGPNEHVFVTHFTSGFVSLVSAPLEVGSQPLFQDTITSLFAPSRLNGTTGAAGVAARLPGDPLGLVYVTSTREARVAVVAVSDGPLDAKERPTEVLVRSQSFFMQGLETSSIEGDARSLTFSPDGSRAYIVNRTPSSLHVLDTSLDLSGKPRNDWLGSVELCEQTANLAAADFGEGPRVVVPCFQNGQVWILDPVDLRLLAIEDSGRGPHGVAISPARKKIYIGNYAEDTITVVDAAPGSPDLNRVVLRLGKPRIVETDD